MNRLSKRVAEAVAKDFIEEAVDLTQEKYQREGVYYEIGGPNITVRTEYPDGRVRLQQSMDTTDFVSGVAYALAERNEISAEMVTTQNIARVCFAIGYLEGQDKAS